MGGSNADQMEHERIRQHVISILSTQSLASLSLAAVGAALHKVHPFKGKLKKILEQFPADFGVIGSNGTEELVLLSSNMAPNGVGSSAMQVMPQPNYKVARKTDEEPSTPKTAGRMGTHGQTANLGHSTTQPVAEKKPSKPLSVCKPLPTPKPLPTIPVPVQSNATHPVVKKLKAKTVAASSNSWDERLIVTQAQLAVSLGKIRAHSVLALDCKGTNLSRTGKLCLVQIAIPTPSSEVFLFDVNSMEPETLDVLRRDLGKILSDSKVTKIVHDCRQDSDALYHQLGIRLEGVFDTQASYVALVKARKSQAKGVSGFVPLPGLNKLLAEYAGRTNAAKDEGKAYMERDPLVWEKRPLPAILLQYAAEDVSGLFAVRTGILRDHATALESQLTLASAEYTSAYRNVRSGPSTGPSSHTQEIAMVFDESGSLVPASDAAELGGRLDAPVAVETRVEELLYALPDGIANDPVLREGEGAGLLMEVVLDYGRRPVARFLDRRRVFLGPETGCVSREDLDLAVAKLGAFGSDNRAGIGGTLHRISAMRERDSGAVLGLTYRVGRAVTGAADPVRDLLKAEIGGNVLILGPPMTGKTTIIRDMARLLSRENWVVIVDTSNEIAGVGAVPHHSVGDARRMQVKDLESQFGTMIECVQNHAPEVIIIDEIGRRREAEAARTIAQRGVRLVSSAHGSLTSLVSNPFLSELLGGVDLVLVGDSAAKLHDGRKNVRQRKQDSIFQTVIELSPERLNEWAIYTDIEAKVDKILKGEPFAAEIRSLDAETREIRVRQEMRVPE